MVASPFAAQPAAVSVYPHTLPRSPRFSPVTISPAGAGPSTRLVTVAGQVATDPATGQVPSDIDAQISLAFRNLRQCLEAVGARVEDVLKLTYYVVDHDPSNLRYAKALMDFLGDHRPASTYVPVSMLALREYKFEVEAIASIPYAGTEEVDVVVVGGGLSGLKAAWDVAKAGLSCVVLEARERVGGKTWSRDSKTGKVDVGAAWINDSNQAYVFQLAQQFGLQTVVQNTEGDIAVQLRTGWQRVEYGGVPADKEYSVAVEGIRNLVEELCQKIDIRDPVGSAKGLGKDLDKVTVEEYVRSVTDSEDAMNNIRISTRALLGVEPTELSMLYLLDYCKSAGGFLLMRSDKEHGGQYLRLPQGTQSFSNCIANELPEGSVKLNSPVNHIRQSEKGIAVESARGRYICKRAIVSVPTPLYKEIKFDPPLPQAKAKLAQSTRLGYYAKAIAVYDRPWWRDAGLCGLLQSHEGPAAVFRDTSVDASGHYSLTLFMTGEPGRIWSRLSKEGRERSALEQIQVGLGQFASVEQPLELIEQQWAYEQWSQGCPCPVMPPGVMTELGHELRATFGKIHFVGTETAYEWKGYMDGALRSGERGAQEVIKKLCGAKL